MVLCQSRSGMILTRRLWGYRFHGIEPSKKSKEKIQRKVRDEMAAKKLATSEQPAGSFNHLKNAQVPTHFSGYQVVMYKLPGVCHAARQQASRLVDKLQR